MSLKSLSRMDLQKLSYIKKYIPNYYKVFTRIEGKLSDANKKKVLDKYYQVALRHVQRIKRNSKVNIIPMPERPQRVLPVQESHVRIPAERHINKALPVQESVVRHITRKPVDNRQVITKTQEGGSNMATYKRPTLQEKIKDWIYDSYNPTNGTDATFFSTPIGGSKTLTNTNMTQGGQLPFSEKFRVIGIGAYITPFVNYDSSSNTDLLDFLKKIQTGNWSLKIMNKTYLQGSLSAILAQNRIEVKTTQATAADGAVVTLDAPFYKEYGYFPVTGGEFTLNNGVNFSITVNWDAAVGASNPFSLYLVLFGLRFRPIQ